MRPHKESTLDLCFITYKVLSQPVLSDTICGENNRVFYVFVHEMED